MEVSSDNVVTTRDFEADVGLGQTCVEGDADLPIGDQTAHRSRHGLGRRRTFERGFDEAFFAGSNGSQLTRPLWERYRLSLGLPAGAGRPLFVLSWLSYAIAKLDYLLASYGEASRAEFFTEPQGDFPLTFFAERRCLNVSLAISRIDELAL